VFLNGLIAQTILLSAKKGSPTFSWLGEEEDCADALQQFSLLNRAAKTLRTVRVVRYYGGNVILIVKTGSPSVLD